MDKGNIKMWDESYRNELLERRKKAFSGGGKKRIETQHAKGKLTARERVDYLFDEGSFEEIGGFIESRITDFGMEKKKLPGDGVITGYGYVNGRLTFVSSEDFTVIGGTLGEAHAKKICQIMDMAIEMKAPFVLINDSGGARIEEGISSLNGYGGLFLRHMQISGKIPQIAAIMGPCAGGACYAPAMCDFVFMTEKTSKMFITGPAVVKAVSGSNVSAEELGGAKIHEEQSGVTHFVYPSDEECLDGIKSLLSYLPQNNKEKPQRRIGKSRDLSYKLQEIVPDRQKQVYNILDVISTLVDEESFFEVQKMFGKSLVVGFGRMDTEVIGIVASQTMSMGGAIDIDASEKAARFIRFCDCFNIPILTLEDVSGFLPGMQQEHAGIIRRGAKLLYAYCEATVPKVTVILRKAFGGAYIAMNSKGMGADVVYAWPIAQIAVMGAEGAADIIFKEDIHKSTVPEITRETKIQEYNECFMSPYIAAERGYIDEVILPEETRSKIRSAFDALKNKQRVEPDNRHGNIPL